LSSDGYLMDPEDESFLKLNAHLVDLYNLDYFQCLILLGEPGMGKSYAMEDLELFLKSNLHGIEDKVIRFDLRRYSSEDRLDKTIFQHEDINSWKIGNGRLYLLLDSLDESCLKINTVTCFLEDEIKKLPPDRLFLRIACRTGDWPSGFENNLRKLWGKDKFAVHELAPLRENDIDHATKEYGLDSNAFKNEVETIGAVPLAIKPVTLELLINIVLEKGHLPSSQTELYEEGLLLMCQDDEKRQEVKSTGQFSPAQRLQVASRAAAVMIFGNKNAINMGLEREDKDEAQITIQDLVGGQEQVSGDRFIVTERAVEEAIKWTGLFTSSGDNKLGWSHQTYAEFLAARYLVKCKVKVGQIMHMILISTDRGPTLIPQLRQTIAWLAGMEEEILELVLNKNPVLLIDSDLTNINNLTKERITKAILCLYEQEETEYTWIDIRKYQKLSYPGIAELLRNYILDKRKMIEARRVALKMAEASRPEEFMDELAIIALDKEENVIIRKYAATAIARIGDHKTSAKLKPLIVDSHPEDKDDEIKGIVFEALWPAVLTAQELFKSITLPSDPNFIGSYGLFLEYALAKHLKAEDMHTALDWVLSMKNYRGQSSDFQGLSDNIVIKAFEFIGQEGTLERLAAIALKRSREYVPLFGESPRERKASPPELTTEQKRTLARNMVLMMEGTDRDASHIIGLRPALIDDKDTEWIIQTMLSETSPKAHETWVRILLRLINPDNVDQASAILMAGQKDSLLGRLLSPWVNPIEIDSELARQAKQDWKMFMENRRDLPLLNPPPAKRVLEALDRFESGNNLAWLDIVSALALEQNARFDRVSIQSDIDQLPGWLVAEDKAKQRIHDAASIYISNSDIALSLHKLSSIDQHLLRKVGYLAFRLLFHNRPEIYESLALEVWTNWGPIILDSINPPNGERGIDDKIIITLYQKAPATVIETLLYSIDHDNKVEGSIYYILYRVNSCLDDRIKAVLLDKTRNDPSLGIKCKKAILEFLIERGMEEARDYLMSQINIPPPRCGLERQWALELGKLLFRFPTKETWPRFQELISLDPSIGKEIVETVLGLSYINEPPISMLEENQLGNLLIWLESLYPHSDGPPIRGIHAISLIEEITMLKSRLISILISKGTPDSIKAIRNLIEIFPDIETFQINLRISLEIALRKSWEPLAPHVIIEIARDAAKRTVQDEDQLLDVIIESLKRLERDLSEKGANREIWDKIGNDKYKPICEMEFSDYIQRHFDRDIGGRGIIVNREVQVRRGSFTDIHVQAVKPDSRAPDSCEILTIVIEVKGCWNNQLFTAMRSQLVDRYLRENGLFHGLYLTGWFRCDAWDDGDPSKEIHKSKDRQATEAELDQQARELSREGIFVRSLLLDTMLKERLGSGTKITL